jgi:hypothetical protein
MIIITIVNQIIIHLCQLTDYIDLPIHESHHIKRYIKRETAQTLHMYFKKKSTTKRLDHSFRHKIKYTHQTTLDRWISPINKLNPSKRQDFPVSDKNPKLYIQKALPIKKQDNIKKPAEKKKVIKKNEIQQEPIPSPLISNPISTEPIENTTEANPTMPKIPEGPFLKDLPFHFFDRFQSIPAVTQDMYCSHSDMKDAWIEYQEIETFMGSFQHLITLNSFSYWDQVEDELRQADFSPKCFSIKEFITWEFLRHSHGLDHYEQASFIFQHYDRKLLARVFENPNQIPQPYHSSYYYQWLKPEHFYRFFLSLVEECVQFGIIIPKILMADGLFERSAAGNFSKDCNSNPTDADATRTVHNKKFYGKGFVAIVFCAWCRKRWLPVDVKVFTGSTNENKFLKPVMGDFLASTPYDWDAILYDTGGSAKLNREFIKDQEIISGITARSNIKQELIIELGTDRYGFWDDIPDGMSIRQYQRLLEHRSQIEATFSPFSTVFNMKRMNDMGWAAAMIHICKYLSLLLLHALTAYKVNAEHLVMKAKAFTQLF